ncbi:head-tail connector protein [Jiella marina]|uniref:head-tail connector protein n=1 Tax=Jiella sp. LLJ827 TaxID=2917712 RepID=UPI0021010D8A|nr:head-tail connector protein [Jiella sp. LLJ827]MCQ0989932.1 head-tail connector protein [Jiella sp. LLJ827]
MTTITLSDLKSHLRLDPDDTSDDTLLTNLIGEATELAAAWIGRDTFATLAEDDAIINGAVMRVAAFCYDTRSETPPAELFTPLNAHREWSF